MANTLQRYILKYSDDIFKNKKLTNDKKDGNKDSDKDSDSDYDEPSEEKRIRCVNPNITLQFMEEHPEFEYDIYNIVENPNITIDELAEYAKKYNIDPVTRSNNIANNKSITIDDIQKYPDLKWDNKYCNIFTNTNITFKIVCDNLNIRWNFKTISTCCDLTWNDLIDIISRPTLKNNTDVNNTDINNTEVNDTEVNDTQDIILNKVFNPKKRDFNIQKYINLLSNEQILDIKKGLVNYANNINLQWSEVESNLMIGWDFGTVFKNPNITVSDLKNFCIKIKKKEYKKFDKAHLKKYPNTRLSIYNVFDNPNIDEEFLNWCKLNKIEIQYLALSNNPAIKFEYIIKNPLKRWNYDIEGIGWICDITFEDIQKYYDDIDGWNSDLMFNDFTYNPIIYRNRIREYLIKSQFCISDITKVIYQYV